MWHRPVVLFSLLYLLVRLLLRAPSPGGDREREFELELIVLRRELMVLKRKIGRPKLRRSDKVFLTVLSRVLPRQRWSPFIVTSGTLANARGSHCAAFLRTLYVLFFIEVGSRRLHITAATPDPDGTFATQQARKLCHTLDRRE
jgi:hypothetical protein